VGIKHEGPGRCGLIRRISSVPWTNASLADVFIIADDHLGQLCSSSTHCNVKRTL
jgi:hypothetical protein